MYPSQHRDAYVRAQDPERWKMCAGAWVWRAAFFDKGLPCRRTATHAVCKGCFCFADLSPGAGSELTICKKRDSHPCIKRFRTESCAITGEVLYGDLVIKRQSCNLEYFQVLLIFANSDKIFTINTQP